MNWQYNEFKQIGKDYSQKEEVEVYEKTHSQFRDLYRECLDLINNLNISDNDILVDFGSGTGVFAIEAAKICKKVYAVDISLEMLEYSQRKAQKESLTNIEFVHSGFLNFTKQTNSVDFVTSTFSFHHLPDFWKKIALKNISNFLKPGGKLYIKDVVIQDNEPLNNIAKFIRKQTKLGGNFLKEDAELHFKEEFSTYDWIIESMLKKTNFEILNKEMEIGLIASYTCKKK